MDRTDTQAAQRTIDRQRWRLLRQIEQWLEIPVALLGILWLILLVIELVRGINPLLSGATQVIWFVFIVEFLVRLFVAPRKLMFLRRNVLTIVALAIPATRGLRAVRALRAVRGLRLVRILTSLNRGMRALRRGLGRRGFGYVFALTLLVAFAGAAGMYALENTPQGRGFSTYTESLWWTGMLMTTIASEFWPRTSEGRLLALLLSVYSVAVFGYLTATLASLFIEHTSSSNPPPDPQAKPSDGSREDIVALREEIASLRAELRASRLTGRSEGKEHLDPDRP